MLARLVANWWIIGVRGLFAIAFGVATIFLSGAVRGPITGTMAMVSVMLLFALYLIASGILSILDAVKTMGHSRRWWIPIAHAAFLLAFGSWIVISSEITIVWLAYFAIAHSVITGTLEIALGQDFRRHLWDELFLTLMGAVSLLAGIILFWLRRSDVDVLLEAIGKYSLFFGAVLVIFSLRLHAFRKPLHQAARH